MPKLKSNIKRTNQFLHQFKYPRVVSYLHGKSNQHDSLENNVKPILFLGRMHIIITILVLKSLFGLSAAN